MSHSFHRLFITAVVIAAAGGCRADRRGQPGAPEGNPRANHADVGGDADAGAPATGDVAGQTDVQRKATDTGQVVDGADGDAGDAPDAAEQPRCMHHGDALRCAHHTAVFDATGEESRKVHWQTPPGPSPSAGWPAAILFQGSFHPAEGFWDGQPGAAMGLYHRVETVHQLLEAGFAVITPQARGDGKTYWDTNIAPYATDWTTAPDHHLMVAVFEAIEDGDFGHIDPDRLYAAGLSSGGYMTSRMAQAYVGRFRALAIMSASYCWCGGYVCQLPDSLPADHPPSLFVHGRLDPIVPLSTMTPYEEALRERHIDTRLLIDDKAGHEWLEQAPAAILDWFQTH